MQYVNLFSLSFSHSEESPKYFSDRDFGFLLLATQQQQQKLFIAITVSSDTAASDSDRQRLTMTATVNCFCTECLCENKRALRNKDQSESKRKIFLLLCFTLLADQSKGFLNI